MELRKQCFKLAGAEIWTLPLRFYQSGGMYWGKNPNVMMRLHKVLAIRKALIEACVLTWNTIPVGTVVSRKMDRQRGSRVSRWSQSQGYLHPKRNRADGQSTPKNHKDRRGTVILGSKDQGSKWCSALRASNTESCVLTRSGQKSNKWAKILFSKLLVEKKSLKNAHQRPTYWFSH